MLEWMLRQAAEDRNQRCTEREEEILAALDKAQAELTQLHCTSVQLELRSKKEVVDSPAHSLLP